MLRNTPSERLVGAALLALLVLCFIAAAISGSDTSTPFDGELARIGQNSDRADAGNVAIRAAAGVGIIASGAVLYTMLRERSRVLATLTGFVLSVGGSLTLVANALHYTLAGIGDEFTAASGSGRDDLLVTGRTLAVLTEQVVGMAMIALMTAIVTLAILFARLRIAPRWLASLPALGVLLLAAALLQTGGSDRDGAWLFFMGGVFSMALWALVTGVILLFASTGDHERPPGPAAVRSGASS